MKLPLETSTQVTAPTKLPAIDQLPTKGISSHVNDLKKQFKTKSTRVSIIFNGIIRCGMNLGPAPSPDRNIKEFEHMCIQPW